MVAKLRQLVQFMARSMLHPPQACTACGCLVHPEDQQRHRDWHNQLENK